MKDSTTLLRTQCDALRNLSPEQFKAAVTAIWDYEMDGIESDDPVAAMAVGMAKPIIDKRAKRAEAGRIGGSKRKQNEANEKQTEANRPYKEESIKVKDKRIKEEVKEEKRFTPPTPQAVREYAAAQGYSLDADRFVDFYESKGWMVGKNKMKDWHAAVRGWASREKQNTSAKGKYVNFNPSGENWDDLAYQVMNQ